MHTRGMLGFPRDHRCHRWSMNMVDVENPMLDPGSCGLI